MNIFKCIRKGDSADWLDNPTTLQGENIQSPDWVLKYAIRGASALTLTGVAENSGWRVSITKAQTSAFSVGTYYWQAYAEKDDERITLGTGEFEVLADLSSGSDEYDGRSQIEKDLEAVQAAMRSIVSGGAMKSYTIGNRSLTKMDMSDLIALESKLKAELAREKRKEMIANGLGDPANVWVRFRK